MPPFGGAQRAVPFFPTPEDRSAAMAFQTPKRGGLFGAPMTPDSPVAGTALTQFPDPAPRRPYDTPPFAPEQAGLPPMAQASDNFGFNMNMANATEKKPSFFQQGGAGQKILHGLGEFALNYSASQGDPLAMATFQNRFAQQAAQRRQQEDAQRRQADQEEWINRQTWQRDHPQAPAPTETERLAVAAGYTPGTPEYTSVMRRGFENKVDPYRAIPYSGPEGDGLLFKRGSELSGPSGTSPPSGAVQHLRQNPALAADFDKKYGPGASSQYLKGGSTPSGSGGFPLYPASR